MRAFEIILLILDAILILTVLFPSRRPRYLLPFVTIATGLALVVHIFSEGARWQMAPAYALTVALLIVAWLQRRSPPEKARPAWRTALYGLLALALLMLATALPVLLPVPTIPEPGGPYAIGTATFHLVDQSRQEIYGDEPGGDRELMLQLWYPAASDSATTLAPYIDQLDVAASVLAERLDLPTFFLGHLALLDTHALIDALPARENVAYPLILFSHGLSGLRVQNTAQFEELASHGYVVASVDHTFDSVITIMPDGRAILHHGESVMPAGVSAILSGRRLVDVRVQDLATALSSLEEMDRDPESPFFERIALDKLGVMGHSTGGATAVEFCAQYEHCRAVLVQDGWLAALSDETLSRSLSQPALFLNAPDWLGEDNRSIGDMFIERQGQDSYQVTIAEMEHFNFSDVPLLTPLVNQLGLAGKIDGARGIRMLNEYSLAFFDRYLQGIDGPALERIADRYWEATLESN